jgi:pimeloyl-ACP methyl ester carboxylesterase
VSPAVKFLRNVGILLAGAMAIVYLASFALLFAYQRSMLFQGSRHAIAPPPPGSIYRMAAIAEPDGTRLTVWRAEPARAGAPTIVFFYGNGGTLADFAPIGEEMHEAGYGIVLASYRGYSGNGGRPSEDGLMEDARAIISSVHGRTVLWGHSLGTGVAARMAAEGRTGALILESPYTAVSDVAARRFPYYPVRLVMWDRFDTLALVPKIKVPVLIMSGGRDRIVPFDMGRTLAQHFGKQATFLAFPEGNHELDGVDTVSIVETWLRAHGR